MNEHVQLLLQVEAQNCLNTCGIFSELQKCKLLLKLQGQKNESKCPSPQRVVSMPTSNFYCRTVWLH